MNIAVIVAGGSGRRMGGETPKQFLTVGGRPIIVLCMETFEHHDEIDEIIVVCHSAYVARMKALASEFGIHKLQTIASAGETRRASVLSGLQSVRDRDSIVLIHDAARPLVSAAVISANIAAAREHGAAVTALPACDTIFRSADGLAVDEVLDRNRLYHAQTPQSFRYELILSAHRAVGADIDATDDCQLALAAGHTVVPVRGDERNFKVTTPEDLARLRALVGE